MKYRNEKLNTPDGSFDSKKEYYRWCELKLMQRAGTISNLERQYKFELIPNQKENGKVIERAITYIADFVYKKDGKTVVEDVKPTFRSEKAEKMYKATAAYKVFTIKRKLMLYMLNIKIIEL